jgi:hypothetical protein
MSSAYGEGQYLFRVLPYGMACPRIGTWSHMLALDSGLQTEIAQK